MAAAYNIPPPLIGILERAIFSNVVELRTHFIRDVLGPWAVRFERAIDAQLLPLSPAWDNLFVSFDLDEQLRPDMQAMADAFQKMRHVRTPNEMRDMVNLPPIDDPRADALWLPMNEQEVGAAEPEPPAETPPPPEV